VSSPGAPRLVSAHVHPDVGEHAHNGLPWRFVGTAPREHHPSPRLGEHSRVILGERLGLTDPEIDRLEADGVTGAVLAKLRQPKLESAP
jgi:crotonobetainyl-CoA:carnitine CoA-transferase CaiB-like acyl-CoA transferase